MMIQRRYFVFSPLGRAQSGVREGSVHRHFLLAVIQCSVGKHRENDVDRCVRSVENRPAGREKTNIPLRSGGLTASLRDNCSFAWTGSV